MITAMQGAKLKAAIKLREAMEALGECRSLICMGRDDSQALEEAGVKIDGILNKMLPSNDGPPPEDMTLPRYR